MKRFLSIACVLVLALTCGLTANAKKKEVCFQMYSVRDLIGNPEKYAQSWPIWVIQLWRLPAMTMASSTE